MEKVRQALLDRNVNNFKQLQRRFRIMDKDRTGQLDFDEFATGVKDIGVEMPIDELKEIFKTLDADDSGNLKIEEFMEAITPPLNDARKAIIKQAFEKFDKTGDQKVTVADLKGVYNVKWNPKFKSGEKTEDELLTEFLESFEPDEASRDGVVTLDEFLKYYAGMSKSYDKDEDFVNMMRVAYL